MSTLQPRPLKSSDWVIQDLTRKIEDNILLAGERLPSVVDLALQYQVGRSTIREALSSLKAMGMLDIRQGSGTYVKEKPTQHQHPAQLYPDAWVSRAKSLKHILEVRRVLESGCASLAANNRTEQDIVRLGNILREMENMLDDEMISEQADVQFHEAIAHATHNPVLSDLMSSLSQQFHDSMKDSRALWFYAERSSAERLLREHQNIYDAIAGSDGKRAQELMDQHIAKVERVLDDHQSASSSLQNDAE
ncbi:FadR/GntR family transcriptional regulator [Paenibacillus guangzhouensis]|uniref:FadR/GntR family transcriptional regulator n=1 Tax=Paenibacillus guangzhouensis TaxID=1473112 RepID=UPI001266DC59|nr:FadR/GntR family transcriptional regulator [Paenibacillus guangzhouensis]